MQHYIIEDLEITDAGAEGKAVGRHNGMIVFVPYAVPGDVVDVLVFKKKRGYAEARITDFKKTSPYRVEPMCPHFGLCGGCKWQSLSYDKQLYYKQKQVDDNFRHLGKFDYPEVRPILASNQQSYYRNKLEFTFSNLRWLDEEDMAHREEPDFDTRGLGFHIPGKFDKVLDIKHCYLQADPSNAIRTAIKEYAVQHNLPFYNIRDHEGLLRNLIIRNTSTGELMVILIVTDFNAEVKTLLDFLGNKFPEITSLQYAINTKLNDAVSDLPVELYKGKSYITEQMEDLKFNIGPVSFYQTNSPQAYKLYSTAREFAQLTPDKVVYDLYTGTGTIANFVARNAKKVVGIEYVDAAIQDAIANSKLNGITNTEFCVGDMAKVFTDEFIAKHGRPDIVITDPPRAGMHQKVVEQLLKIKPERIVYISCNPATQARDLTQLCTAYKVLAVQPVDMFPHTHHVENVVVLEELGERR